MSDLISRADAIKDVETWTAVDEHERHLQKNVIEWLKEFPTAEVGTDMISRQDAIDALWKALYDYEDKTEKQFQESEELDVGDWIVHRIFVQNMSDIDRQIIIELPSAQPELIRCKDCKHADQYNHCDRVAFWNSETDYCSRAERRTDE